MSVDGYTTAHTTSRCRRGQIHGIGPSYVYSTTRQPMQFSGAAEQAERMRIARDAGELPPPGALLPRATKTPSSAGTRAHRRNHSDSSAMRMLSVMSPGLHYSAAQSLGKRTPEEGGTGEMAQSCGAASKYQRQAGGDMAPPYGLPSVFAASASRDDYNWRQVISALVSDNQSPAAPVQAPKVVVKSEQSGASLLPSFSFDHTLGSSLDVMAGFMGQHLTSLASESTLSLIHISEPTRPY